MRIPPRVVVLAAFALLAGACSARDAAVGQGMASIVVPIPASAAPSVGTSPSPAPSPSSNAPPPSQTPLAGGVYVGRARLARTNLTGVSHRPQRIRWGLRPRCVSANCPVLLLSKSGGFTLLLHRHGDTYGGFTRRRGFFTCVGKPERVTLRIVLRATASTQIGGRWFATRIAATLENVSVPSPRCRRSYLNTVIVANRT
jgi:hypothetical protein